MHPMVGRMFGRLKIIRVLSVPPNKNSRRMCCAECSCGSGRKLYGLKNIKRGTTKSCDVFGASNRHAPTFVTPSVTASARIAVALEHTSVGAA